MKLKWWLSGAFFIGIAIFSALTSRAPNMSFAQHGTSGRFSNVFVTHDYEELSATGASVVAITPGIIDTTYPDATHRAYITVSGQGIRYTCDGTTPSTSLGNPLPVGATFQIVSLLDIQNFQFVNDDASGTAVCHVNLQYEKEMNE